MSCTLFEILKKYMRPKFEYIKDLRILSVSSKKSMTFQIQRVFKYITQKIIILSLFKLERLLLEYIEGNE